MKNKGMVWPGIILGIVFFVIAIVYWTHTAGQLPSFFPGHLAGASGKHIKHGLASFIVGLACFVYAWFASAPKKTI